MFVGKSALHIAILHQHTSLCDFLIKHGADVNPCNPLAEENPLLDIAVYHGYTEVGTFHLYIIDNLTVKCLFKISTYKNMVVVVRLSIHVHFNITNSYHEISEFPDRVRQSAP